MRHPSQRKFISQRDFIAVLDGVHLPHGDADFSRQALLGEAERFAGLAKFRWAHTELIARTDFRRNG